MPQTQVWFACGSSAQYAEAGRDGIRGQLGMYKEFHASLCYTTLCQKKVVGERGEMVQ